MNKLKKILTIITAAAVSVSSFQPPISVYAENGIHHDLTAELCASCTLRHDSASECYEIESYQVSHNIISDVTTTPLYEYQGSAGMVQVGAHVNVKVYCDKCNIILYAASGDNISTDVGAGSNLYTQNGTYYGTVTDGTITTAPADGSSVRLVFPGMVSTSDTTTVTQGCYTVTYGFCSEHGLSGVHYYCDEHNYIGSAEEHYYSGTCTVHPKYSGTAHYINNDYGYVGSLEVFDAYDISITDNANKSASSNYSAAAAGANLVISFDNKTNTKLSITGQLTGTEYFNSATSDSSYSMTMPSEPLAVTVDNAQMPQTITAADITKYFGDTDFSIGAATNGNGVLTYVSSNPSVVSVSADGTAHIRSVGYADITITAAETAEYFKSEKKIRITILKATPNFSNEQINSITATGITYGQSLADSTLNGSAPVDGTFIWEDDTIKPAVADSNITQYAVKFVPADSNNYSEVSGLSATVEVSKAALTFSDEQVNSITATGITYGQSLADSVLNGSAPVDGTFIWEDDTIKPAVSDSNITQYAVKFVPADSNNYSEVSGLSATVEVSKAVLTFSDEQVNSITATGITYGQSLADSIITGSAPIDGTFIWEDDTIKPAVSDSNITQYGVKFVPADSNNYSEVSGLSATVEVSKAAPTFSDEQINSITATGITYGQSLACSVLNGIAPVDGTFIWEDDTIKPAVADSNITRYAVKFIPTYSNYNEVSGLQTTLVVNPAQSEIKGDFTYTKTYGDEPFKLNVMSDNGLDFVFSVNGDCVKVDADGTVTILSAGSVIIRAETINPDYENTYVDIQIIINKATPDFTDEQVNSITATGITYGQRLVDSVITGNAPVDGTFIWADDTIIPEVADSNIIDYEIIFVPTDTKNYNEVKLTAKLEVRKYEPDDVVGDPITKKTIDADFTVTDTLVSDGTRKYSSSNPRVAAISSDGVVTLNSCGECDIIITVDETENYMSCREVIHLTVTSVSSASGTGGGHSHNTAPDKETEMNNPIDTEETEPVETTEEETEESVDTSEADDGGCIDVPPENDDEPESEDSGSEDNGSQEVSTIPAPDDNISEDNGSDSNNPATGITLQPIFFFSAFAATAGLIKFKRRRK